MEGVEAALAAARARAQTLEEELQRLTGDAPPADRLLLLLLLWGFCWVFSPCAPSCSPALSRVAELNEELRGLVAARLAAQRAAELSSAEQAFVRQLPAANTTTTSSSSDSSGALLAAFRKVASAAAAAGAGSGTDIGAAAAAVLARCQEQLVAAISQFVLLCCHLTNHCSTLARSTTHPDRRTTENELQALGWPAAGESGPDITGDKLVGQWHAPWSTTS